MSIKMDHANGSSLLFFFPGSVSLIKTNKKQICTAILIYSTQFSFKLPNNPNPDKGEK